MTDSQQNQQSNPQQQQQSQQQQQQQQQQNVAAQRQISQNPGQQSQNQQANSSQQQQPLQPQQQAIQPQQQSIQPQQQPIQQQPVQQQAIQQLPQLQQIAPQQPQHVMPNLQGHNMTSVPLSMAMATNPMNNNIGTMRPQQLGQIPQVQVIHQAMQSPPYLPQFAYNHQQLMLQNMQAAMQANMVNMNPQQINMANMVAMQGRPNTNMFTQMSQGPATPTTPNMISISSGTSTPLTQMTSTATGTTNTSKPVQSGVNKQQQQTQQGTIQQQQNQQQGSQQQQQAQIHTLGPVQQAQATAMVGGKPIILGQAAGSLLGGQLGVISAGQLPTSQAYAGQAFGQIQSKPNQQLGVTNTGQGQSIQISSQSGMRFSQPQLASNAGNAQLITSPITNQMLQAMASQLQQYPQQPIMSAQGQSPTIIAGQGLYIRSANPVQAQGLMAGVQTAINPTFKGANQQTVQTVALPIQKQTTAAQTGKVLLPSVSKAATAKVLPSNASTVAKPANQVLGKPKGRPKGTAKVTTPTSGASASDVPIKSESPASNASKPSTPTNHSSTVASHDTKSQSDSENDVIKKSVTNEENEEATPENDEKTSESKMEETAADNKDVTVKQDTILETPPVEKQRAIVKPHILTHVIEGFVIQEGPEPFPVQRSSLMTEFIPPKPGQPIEQSSLISMDEDEMDQEDATSPEDQGRVLKRKRHGKGKRGMHGNRLQSSSSAGGGGDDMDMEDQSSSVSQETPSPSTTPDHRLHTPPPELQLETDLNVPLTSPSKWNVQDVYEFVKALPGCSSYADEFKSQEIDGQALLLLKEDHLMTTMNMKLGPALKICARINAIKDETG